MPCRHQFSPPCAILEIPPVTAPCARERGSHAPVQPTGEMGQPCDGWPLFPMRRHESFAWPSAKNRHCGAMTEQNDPQSKAGAIIVPVTLFEQNCTIIWDEPGKKAW